MALKQQCATNEKERVALRTILEVKIKGLVDSMGRTAEKQRSLKAAPLVIREVQALQKLLGAVLGAYA